MLNLSKFFASLVIYLSIFGITNAQSENSYIGEKTDIKILDKISSKNELVNLVNGEELIYKDLAIKIGTDKFAISYDELRLNEMDRCFLHYIKKGFQLNFIEDLKIKGIYLDHKMRVGKYIKKFIKNDN